MSHLKLFNVSDLFLGDANLTRGGKADLFMLFCFPDNVDD